MVSKAAEQGELAAQYHLGRMLCDKGNGVEKVQELH